MYKDNSLASATRFREQIQRVAPLEAMKHGLDPNISAAAAIKQKKEARVLRILEEKERKRQIIDTFRQLANFKVSTE